MISYFQMQGLLIGQNVIARGNDKDIKEYIGRVVDFNQMSIKVRHPIDQQDRWYSKDEIFVSKDPLDSIEDLVKKIADCIPGGNMRTPDVLTRLDTDELIGETRKNLAKFNLQLMEMQKRGVSFKIDLEWSPELQIAMTYTADPFGVRS